MRKTAWLAALALAISCSVPPEGGGGARPPGDTAAPEAAAEVGAEPKVEWARGFASIEVGEPARVEGGADAKGPATVDKVSLDAAYVASGDSLGGRALVTLPGDARVPATLCVTFVATADVAREKDDSGAASGRCATLAQVTIPSAGAWEVPLVIDTAGMLLGEVRVEAKLLRDEPGAVGEVVSSARSPTARVGARRRVDLSGDWEPIAVEEWKALTRRPPESWKLPEPKTVRLPGSLDAAFTEHFRGWVTLERRVAWEAREGLAPRFLVARGVQDGLLAKVNGREVGEARSEKELDCTLTHWLEFHGKGRLGEQNTRRNRDLMKDVDVIPDVRWPLPEALAPSGEADLEVRIRGTSGAFRRKPAYGVHGDFCLELAPAVHIRGVTFDTEMAGDARRITFKLDVAAEPDKPFEGRLRTVYGEYRGRVPYTGACPAVADDTRAVTVQAGGGELEVAREERPRFATCRATFVLEDSAGRVLDAVPADYHTVAVEIRDRRDIYLNSERFVLKGRGSGDRDANQRWQLRLNGVNAVRGHYATASREWPACESAADLINERLADGILTSAGSALFASCERCAFWNPEDTSNVTRAVEDAVRSLASCPGIVEWEAFNELFGEPEEVRVKVAEEFHRLDPYHRPVLMTKGGGEWEAEAREGRVAGPDIVGVQYLLSKEGVDSVTASITEQPLVCSEVNWNDNQLVKGDMWEYWLSKGLAGSLLFDYSGNSTDQGAPLVPWPDREREDWGLMRQAARDMYQELVADAVRLEDGRVGLAVANRMPYAVRKLVLRVRESAAVEPGDLAPGEGVDLMLPADVPLAREGQVAVMAEYETHGGFPHVAVLTPDVKAAPHEGQAPSGGSYRSWKGGAR